MKYDEAFKIIEDFNINSGLRDFCTNVCEGQCCFRCDDQCYKYNERRIVCSAFFCGDILGLLFDNKDRRVYRHEIQQNMKHHIESCLNLRGVETFYLHLNTEQMDILLKSEFPDAIKQIKDFDTEKIKEIVNNFTPKQIEYLRGHVDRIRGQLEIARLKREKRKKES